MAILAVWELSARALTGAYLLAGPSEVAVYLWQNAGLMGRALRTTLTEAAAGFVLGNATAILLAALAVAVPRAEKTIAALALLVFCLPLVATGPILRVLFGPGPGPQITLAALAVYYTTLVPLLVGLRAAPDVWFDLVRSYGRGRIATLLHVRAMAALPYLFAGLQIAAPAAFLGAMVGEFTGAESGMGVLTIRATRALDVEATWALAIVAALTAMLAYGAVGWLARRLLSEKPPVLLAASGGAPAKRPWAGVLQVVAVAGLAILLWWGILEAFGVNGFFGKRPGDVWAFLVRGSDAAEHRSTLAGALSETLVYVLPGYLAGLALGALIAVLLTLAPQLSGIAMPVAITLRSVPIVTTAPLVVLVLGRGVVGTVTLVAIMVFFPTLIACLHGLRQAPGQVIDVFDAYASGRIRRLLLAQIPAMWPAFFAAARMSVPAAVLAVTVVEWLATGRGIGALMALSASLSDYGMLWSSVVVVAILSSLVYASVAWVEARVLSVYAAEQTR